MIPIIDPMSSLLLKTVTPKQIETGSGLAPMIAGKEGQQGLVVNDTWNHLRKGEEVLVAWDKGGVQICLVRSLEIVKKN